MASTYLSEAQETTLHSRSSTVQAPVVFSAIRSHTWKRSLTKSQDASILLVEDDDLLRDLTASLLKEAGYQVRECSNASVAREMFYNGIRVDLLIMDLRMPGLSGITLAKELCLLQIRLPTMIVSGDSLDQAAWCDWMTRGWRFLKKPYAESALRAAINELLNDCEDVDAAPKHVITTAESLGFGSLFAGASHTKNGLLGPENLDEDAPLMNGRDMDDTGMELRDLLLDEEFVNNRRNLERHRHPLDALKRVAQVFADSPEAVLQALVNIAVQYCGADSAGISLEETDEKGSATFRWVAIAGSFAQYLNGRTPRFFSPCGTCLSTGRAQLYRVTKPYYDFLGVVAEPIQDGILIPWIADDRRGTIWAVAHGSRDAFDFEDYELLKSLADLAAIAVQQQAVANQKRLVDRIEASAERADQMAHLINNPLQGLTNTLYLARESGEGSKHYLDSAYEQLMALSETVRMQLTLQYKPNVESA